MHFGVDLLHGVQHIADSGTCPTARDLSELTVDVQPAVCARQSSTMPVTDSDDVSVRSFWYHWYQFLTRLQDILRLG